MGKESLISKIKNIVFRVVTPIYLWSIGIKTLEEYWDAIYEHEKMIKDQKND